MTRRWNEPRWCAGGHDQVPILHRSRPVNVGPDRSHGNGQVFMWLQSGGDGPVRVGVGAAHMTSVSAILSLDDARRVRDELSRLIELAQVAAD